MRTGWREKKVLVAICLVGIFASFVPGFEVAYAGYECASTGVTSDWNTASTWGTCNGAVPQVGDNVTISHAVTIGAYTINGVTNVTIASGGTLTQNNTNTQTITGTLTVQSGGTLTHSANTVSPHSYEVDFAANIVDVQVGGSIDLDAKGFKGGTGTGAAGGPGPGVGLGNSVGGGGGAHCGSGGAGKNNGTGGTAYDDANNPVLPGSGGGGSDSSSVGGKGGGLLFLNVTGALTINGTITADGANGVIAAYGAGTGGGGGGAVNISAGSILGDPVSFTTNGGVGYDASEEDGGGGGGGCMHLSSESIVSTVNSVDATYSQGTGYISGSIGSFIWVDPTPTAAPTTCTSMGDGDWDLITWDCGRLPLDTDSVVINSSVVIPSGMTIPVLADLTINEGKTLAQQNLLTQTITGTLTIDGTLTHTANGSGSSHVYEVDFVANIVTIGVAGSINLDAKGFQGGTGIVAGGGPGPGVSFGNSVGGGGGGHCGVGGAGFNGGTGGIVNDDANNPVLPGSGGGGSDSLSVGGKGGGLLLLNVIGALTINGTITANGANGVSANYGAGTGGGAGGGINITAGSITGTPVGFSADGGIGYNASQEDGGGAGGGCVYVTYGSGVVPSATVTGGTAGDNGTVGTVGSFLTALSNSAPTVTINSAEQDDGEGTVIIEVEVDDADNNDTVFLTVEYEAGSCSGSEVNATLDATDDNVTATYGDPDVSGSQVGSGANFITTSEGANTVTFNWDSDNPADVPTANGTYCIKITPNDGAIEGTPDTVDLTVDNVDPVSAGNLTYLTSAPTSLTFTLGAAGTDDSGIKRYRIYYQAGASGVTEGSSLSETIVEAAYAGTETVSVGSLSANTQYVTNIFTYDLLDNVSNAVEIAKYTAANTPGAPTVNGATVSALNVTIDVNSNPATTEFAIQETSTGNYVQGDGTLSGSAVWQAVGTGAGQWGEDLVVSGKVQVTGLSLGTQYTFQVMARNGNEVPTAYGATAALYTLAEASSAPTVDSATVSSLGVTISQGSNPSTTTYKIQETGGSLYVQTDGTLGADPAWQTAANWGTGGKKTVTGLSVNTQYTFATTARNVDLVETAASDPTSAYTAANAPGVPTVNGAATTTLDVTIDTNSNTSTTEYYIYEVNTAQYVQADGTLGGVVVWDPVGLAENNWGYTTGVSGKVQVTGLSVNTTYDFKVKARNGDAVETAFGTSASLYTLANAPGVPTVNGATATTLDITLDVNSNPITTTFAIQETTGLDYVQQADGTMGASEDWQTNATWGTMTVTGLMPNTSYTYKAKARNGNGTETVFGTAAAATYTLANVPVSVSVSNSGNGVVVTWGANSNTASTEYYAERSGAGANSGWTTATTWTDNSGYGGTNYTYSVKARNVNLVETATASSASVLYPGGGVVLPSSSARKSTVAKPKDVVVDVIEDESGEEVVVVEDGEDNVVLEVSEEQEPAGEDMVGPVNIDYDLSQSVLSERIVSYVGGNQSALSEVGFDVEEYLTRAAAIKAICLRIGIDLDSEEYDGARSMLDRILGFIFKDVEDFDTWYVSYVGIGKIMGIVNGYSDNTFRPGGKVSRAEAIKMIVVANQWDIADFDVSVFPFVDIYEGDWYAGYLQTAYNFGVLRSYYGEDFEPTTYITVDEFSMLLSYLDNEVDESEFLVVMVD